MYSYTLTLSVFQIVFVLAWLAVLLWLTHKGSYYSGRNSGLDLAREGFLQSCDAVLEQMRAEEAKQSAADEPTTTEARL
ncbi:hypothetical protein [Prosthecobacter sp.]|jgi:hypothetical protein|uniref:hypothetical protein n=1 Tax=Prosthecobacter sp. TaxID=1965333 RepID=UPI0037C6D1B3